MSDLILYKTGYYMTADDIAQAVGVGRTSVLRKAGIEYFFIGSYKNPNGIGRNIDLYSPKALALWGVNDEQIQEFSYKLTRKKHKNRGKAQQSKITPELEAMLVENVKSLFLSSANKNAKLACEHACEEYYNINGPIPNFDTPEKLADYLYYNRIRRKNGTYVGYYHKDNWKYQWETIFQNSKANATGPNNRWDTYGVLHSAGILKPGAGAGDIWVIDGSNLDAWLKKGDENKLTSYFQIIDAITGFPLLVTEIENESTVSLNGAIAACVKNWGVPRYGFVLDNSKAARSPGVRNFLKRLYPESYVREFNQTNHWWKEIFPGNEFPSVYNLPNIPRFQLKARIERTFRIQKDEFVATHLPMSYQGADRNEAVHFSLSNAPTELWKNAPSSDEAYEKFQKWLYNDCIKRRRNTMFSDFVVPDEVPLKMEDIFNYFRNPVINNVPLESAPYIYYYLSVTLSEAKKRNLTDRPIRHTVKAGLANAVVTHLGVTYNYLIDEPDFRLQGRKITVIPHWEEPRKAFLFLEHDENYYSALVPEKGDIFYLGEANDGTLRTLSDKHLIYKRKTIQKKLEKDVKKEIGNHKITAWEDVYKDNEPPRQDFPKIKHKTEPALPAYEPEYLDEINDDNLLNFEL